MKIAIVDHGRSIPRKQILPGDSFKNHLWRAVVDGLTVLGHRCEYLNVDAWMPDSPGVPCDADGYIFWNGQKKHRLRCKHQVQAAGKLIICVEHGWFERDRYYHFSLGGHFGPFAHFAPEMATKPVNEIMLARMVEITGGIVEDDAGGDEADPRPAYDYDALKVVELRQLVLNADPGCDVRKYRKPELIAYVRELYSTAHAGEPKRRHALVAQQVNGDAQHGPEGYNNLEWTNSVLKAIADARWAESVHVRCHPMGVTFTAAQLTIPESLKTNVVVYNGRDVDLQADIAGASIVIAHNSNLVNEALLKLKPCITTGTHLANMTPGVVMKAEPDNIDGAITLLMKGWAPKREAVEAYLARLCDRQWNVNEIRAGRVLARLLSETQV